MKPTAYLRWIDRELYQWWDTGNGTGFWHAVEAADSTRDPFEEPLRLMTNG